jgi:hypothetical protein
MVVVYMGINYKRIGLFVVFESHSLDFFSSPTGTRHTCAVHNLETIQVPLADFALFIAYVKVYVRGKFTLQ